MSIVTVNKNTYTAGSLYRWDKGQELLIYGLSLASAPEVHFSHEGMGRAIVRQASMDDAGVIRVLVPDSLLQKPYKVRAHICVYEDGAFKTKHKIEIPVADRPKPEDYTLEEGEEVYSFNALENRVENALVAMSVATDAAQTAASDFKAHHTDTEAHAALFAAKQDKLTGSVGQVVGFDPTGKAVAQRAAQVAKQRLAAFTEPGAFAWTCPADVVQIDVLLAGGGQGGGYTYGGSGGEVVLRTLSVVPGTTYRFTVGAGGAAASPTAADGEAGENTVAFDLTARGGTRTGSIGARGGAANPETSGYAPPSPSGQHGVLNQYDGWYYGSGGGGAAEDETRRSYPGGLMHQTLGGGGIGGIATTDENDTPATAGQPGGGGGGGGLYRTAGGEQTDDGYVQYICSADPGAGGCGCVLIYG